MSLFYYNKRYDLFYLVNFLFVSRRTKYDEDYRLITKTDAKAEFLLKDCDFDFREPPLKYMLKRNPHKNRHEMKLYVYMHCKERALLVHEDLDSIEEKREQRVVNLHKTRQKNYENKLKVLRREARQGTKKLTQFHQHEYDEPVYNEEDDVYYKVCKTCEHRLEYEEMWNARERERERERENYLNWKQKLFSKILFCKSEICLITNNLLNINILLGLGQRLQLNYRKTKKIMFFSFVNTV